MDHTPERNRLFTKLINTLPEYDFENRIRIKCVYNWYISQIKHKETFSIFLCQQNTILQFVTILFFHICGL